MSGPVIYGCCAITLLAVCACGPRLTPAPNHPSAEARNAETEKKTRKQRPPLVAPPPAYGNKIVLDPNEVDPELAQSQPTQATL